MTDSARILLIEDEAPQRQLVGELLRDAGYQVATAASGEAGLQQLADGIFDLVLCDWKLPGMDGMEVFRCIQKNHFDAAFVMVSAYGTIARAVEAVRAGADDYLAKPFERETLLLAIERGLRARHLADENRRLSQQLSEQDRLVDMVGRAPGMQQVYGALRKVAETEVTVLLLGESGTGKELAARALHALSARKDGPFIAVNCAAIPVDLADAAFFGARKGAYTGADRDRSGYFQAASGGTLFLDEVGELPTDLQAKLLRALQERKVTPVGEVSEVNVDARLVAATNRDLESEAQSGRFREDLYYRLAVVPIRMPPLRERREDLPLLVDHLTGVLLRRHGIAQPEFPSAVTRWLLNHSWPGNVRELSNTLERLLLLAVDGRVQADDLPGQGVEMLGCHFGGGANVFELGPDGMNWDQHESDVLRQAMELVHGNRTRAAKLLEMPYKAFLYRLEKYGLKDVR
ncbi:MAG: sigma-54-dependent Fis family transcriptional regulator [Planctomycetes bacterium]|nr:sigma-54-dependent Fis family transcriptional regulator [Planctomycetota bacterium]